jgi:Membrane protein putatively involved in post-translational modification of the autoinducing quorum-sensing peptide
MIERMSVSITNKLLSKYSDELPSYSKVKFVIKVLITNSLPLILLYLLSYLTGERNNYIIAIVAFALSRKFSGGYHSKNADVCVLMTTSILFFIANYSYIFYNCSLYLKVSSLLLCLVFAPSNIVRKTRVKEDKHIIFKIISVVLVLISFFIDNDVISAAIFIQSLLLIRYHMKEVGKVEKA